MTSLNSIEIFCSNNIDFVLETFCNHFTLAINVTVCFERYIQNIFSFHFVRCLVVKETRPPTELESKFVFCNVSLQQENYIANRQQVCDSFIASWSSSQL